MERDRKFHQTRESDLRCRKLYGVCIDYIFPDNYDQRGITEDLKWWREDARDMYWTKLRKLAR